MKRFTEIVLSILAVTAMTAAVIATVVLCLSVLLLTASVKLGLWVADLQQVDRPAVFAPLTATAKAGSVLVATVTRFAIREGLPIALSASIACKHLFIKAIARLVVGGRALRRLFDFDSAVGLITLAANGF